MADDGGGRRCLLFRLLFWATRQCARRTHTSDHNRYIHVLVLRLCAVFVYSLLASLACFASLTSSGWAPQDLKVT